MLHLDGARFRDPRPQFGSYPQPPMGAGHLSAEYDPRPSAVREARAQVRRQLEGWGPADLDDLADVAELLVSELATNALLHSASRFRLTLSASHGILRCEVEHAGRRVPTVLAAGASESGRGMSLVNALARRWGCHQDGRGKTVWFELGTCPCAVPGAGGRPFALPAAVHARSRLGGGGARPRGVSHLRAVRAPRIARPRPLVGSAPLRFLDPHGGHHGKHSGTIGR